MVQLSMIEVMTSCIPKRALRAPVIAPMRAPPATPAMTTRGIWSGMGRSSFAPTSTAQTAPAMYWPSAPMLKRPVLNAKATEMPVRMMGAALMIVFDTYFGLEKTPSKRAANEAPGS